MRLLGQMVGRRLDNGYVDYVNQFGVKDIARDVHGGFDEWIEQSRGAGIIGKVCARDLTRVFGALSVAYLKDTGEIGERQLRLVGNELDPTRGPD